MKVRHTCSPHTQHVHHHVLTVLRVVKVLILYHVSQKRTQICTKCAHHLHIKCYSSALSIIYVLDTCLQSAQRVYHVQNAYTKHLQYIVERSQCKFTGALLSLTLCLPMLC